MRLLVRAKRRIEEFLYMGSFRETLAFLRNAALSNLANGAVSVETGIVGGLRTFVWEGRPWRAPWVARGMVYSYLSVQYELWNYVSRA